MSAGGGVPYIGSKISLISKAQIRYEGILSSVDTDRSTVALAKGRLVDLEEARFCVCLSDLSLFCYWYIENTFAGSKRTHFNYDKINIPTVKSYGTEDRHTDRSVPPKDEIYEYIIFRGSDIKDITVSEPPKSQHGLPCDPAIVQVCERLHAECTHFLK